MIDESHRQLSDYSSLVSSGERILRHIEGDDCYFVITDRQVLKISTSIQNDAPLMLVFAPMGHSNELVIRILYRTFDILDRKLPGTPEISTIRRAGLSVFESLAMIDSIRQSIDEQHFSINETHDRSRFVPLTYPIKQVTPHFSDIEIRFQTVINETTRIIKIIANNIARQSGITLTGKSVIDNICKEFFCQFGTLYFPYKLDYQNYMSYILNTRNAFEHPAPDKNFFVNNIRLDSDGSIIWPTWSCIYFGEVLACDDDIIGAVSFLEEMTIRMFEAIFDMTIAMKFNLAVTKTSQEERSSLGGSFYCLMSI